MTARYPPATGPVTAVVVATQALSEILGVVVHVRVKSFPPTGDRR